MPQQMSAIGKARRERKRLEQRRDDLAHAVMDTVEQRRELAQTRRELVAKRKSKKHRDPENQEREEQLERQVARLHDKIMEKGDELDALSERIEKARGRRGKVTKKLKAVLRRITKLLKRTGPDAAIRAAENDNGKHEEPAGSNWGPYVSKVIKFTGYSGPVYWCGCAVTWWVIKKAGGEAANRIRRGYAGYVAADARANTNGLRAVSSPVKGGWGTLWGYEHIVMTTGRMSGSLVETWEGNTSASNGSQSNGGEVATKWRNFSDFDVFAAQSY